VKKYATGLEIKKRIIKELKKGPISLRKLETKLNIGYNTLKRHCQELKFFEFVNLEKTTKNMKNGRPYLIIKLTNKGKNLKI